MKTGGERVVRVVERQPPMHRRKEGWRSTQTREMNDGGRRRKRRRSVFSSPKSKERRPGSRGIKNRESECCGLKEWKKGRRSRRGAKRREKGARSGRGCHSASAPKITRPSTLRNPLAPWNCCRREKVVQPRGRVPLPGSCSCRLVSRSSAHPEKAGFWLAAGDAPAGALWIKGTLQGLRLDARALCLAQQELTASPLIT